MKINIGAGIQFRSGLARDVYAAGGVRPEFVGDFTGGVYRVDSAASTFADAFTFARTGTATFVDADGILQTAADGVARTGHHIWNGSEWTGPFLRLESEARTNLLLRSEEFDNAAWFASNASITANTTTAPDGAMTADTIAFSASDGFVLQDYSTTTDNTYVYSIYLRAESATTVIIRIQQNGGASNFLVCSLTTSWQRFNVSFDTSSVTFVRALIQANSNTPTVQAWGAQLEAGSTPSSYIPTTGTTATRNAETLTIAAADAPWSEPVVIGPELVTNGDFSSGTSGWLAGANTTLSVVGGALRIQAVANGSASASQTLTGLTVGAVYKVSFDCVAETQTTGSPNYSAFGEGAVPVTAGVSYEAIIVADNTSESITFSLGGAALSGEYLEVDNVSVKEINPLSVSIQMEGTVNYADDDTFSTVEFVSRKVDGSNFITSRLDTNAANEGKVLFGQTSLGVFDFVQDITAYSPGINVPFNIASRHGSTFINGAVDGTALTADLTPTSLPDLSATDVDIGPIFMGSIGRIVIWADDIADAGIAAASA